MKLPLAFLLLALTASAQTNILITTNRVMAHPSFRVVQGKLYNSAKSTLWVDWKGEVQGTLPGLLLVQTFVDKKRYLPVDAQRSYGNFLFSRGEREYQIEEQGGPFILVTNYGNATPGGRIYFQAMMVGTLEYLGEVRNIWDCGTNHYATVIRTNRVALRK